MNTEQIREPVTWEVQAQLRPLYIDGADLSLDVVEQIHQWARQCVADEREACAKVCEELFQRQPPYTNYFEGAQDCANAIRSRGK